MSPSIIVAAALCKWPPLPLLFSCQAAAIRSPSPLCAMLDKTDRFVCRQSKLVLCAAARSQYRVPKVAIDQLVITSHSLCCCCLATRRDNAMQMRVAQLFCGAMCATFDVAATMRAMPIHTTPISQWRRRIGDSIRRERPEGLERASARGAN